MTFPVIFVGVTGGFWPLIGKLEFFYLWFFLFNFTAIFSIQYTIYTSFTGLITQF